MKTLLAATKLKIATIAIFSVIPFLHACYLVSPILPPDETVSTSVEVMPSHTYSGTPAVLGGFTGPAPTSVFVNDHLYQIHILDSWGHSDDIPELDDTWNYLGDINSVILDALPTANFQANTAIKGAKVYHSKNGSIKVNIHSCEFVRPQEFYGDSIIIDFYGRRSQYIAKDLISQVSEIYDICFDYGMLLRLNGVMYRVSSFMEFVESDSAEGTFILDGDYVYLGKILSSVPENELPTEDFQVNNPYLYTHMAEVYSISHSTSDSKLALLLDNNTQIFYKECS